MGRNIDYIVDKFSNVVFRTAFSYCGSYHEAEDIVSDVMMKYFDNCTKLDYENDEHIKAWLIRVTINMCKDFVKSSRYKKNCQLDESQGGEFMWSDTEIDVGNAISQLDEKYRIVLFLYYFEGYKTDEIAALLKTTKGTVVSRLSRARGKLKISLADYDPSEEMSV